MGHTVNVLRKCLVEGFNIREDVSNIEILSVGYIKISFLSPHNFVEDQTIKIDGTIFEYVNDEFRVVSFDELTITCEVYKEFEETYIDTLINSFEGVTVKVAPLGFIEKFRDNNRSVFTTDEDEAYFYIDDEEPTQWFGSITANMRPAIAPLVFMTDKMDNINDYGKFIVPYDSANPTRFKAKDWLNGTYKQTGLWNWVTYGFQAVISNSNTLLQSQIPTNWTIIGNGRFFYFITVLTYNNVNYNGYYYFGKPNNTKENLNDLKYITNTAGYTTSVTNSYQTARFTNIRSKFFLESMITNDTLLNIDIGQAQMGVLKIQNKSSRIHFNPHISIGTNLESGQINKTHMTYPENYTKKLYMSDYHITTDYGYIGKLSGAKFIYNGHALIHTNKVIYKYNKNGKNKKYFCINDNFPFQSDGNSSTISVQKVIFISLNNEDWYNYD